MAINIYSIIIYTLAALIFLWRIMRGYKTGFVKELANALSIVIALLVGYLIRNIVISYMAAKYGRILAYLSIIAIVLIVYKVIKLIFGALKLFTTLPVLKFFNKILGAVLGFGEAFLIILFSVKVIKELLELI